MVREELSLDRRLIVGPASDYHRDLTILLGCRLVFSLELLTEQILHETQIVVTVSETTIHSETIKLSGGGIGAGCLSFLFALNLPKGISGSLLCSTTELARDLVMRLKESFTS